MKKLERFKRYGSSISTNEPRMIRDKQGSWCKFEEVKPLIEEFQKDEREFWTSVARRIVDICRVNRAILVISCLSLLFVVLS